MLRFKAIIAVIGIVGLLLVLAAPAISRKAESSNYLEPILIFEKDYSPQDSNDSEAEIPFEVTPEQKEEARKCFQKYININYRGAASLEDIADKVLSDFDKTDPKDGLDQDEVKAIIEKIEIDTWFPGEWAKEIIKLSDKDGDKKLSRQECIDLLKEMNIEIPPPPTPPTL
jgi:hypothetical protein